MVSIHVVLGQEVVNANTQGDSIEKVEIILVELKRMHNTVETFRLFNGTKVEKEMEKITTGFD